MNKYIHALQPAVLVAGLLITLVAGVSPVSAQEMPPSIPDVPITYQGQLKDGGSPAHGIYDLRFDLMSLETGGIPIANTVTNPLTAVTNGLFTVLLNFHSEPSAFKTATDRWLEISVRRAGSPIGYTVLTPRQRITPSPYAFHAKTAGRADSAGTVSWNDLTDIPFGFADGNDDVDIFQFVPGPGLSDAVGGTIGVVFGGSGTSNTVARGDHTHPAADITSGTLPSARLGGTYSGALEFPNINNIFFGHFHGDGASFTNLNASALTQGSVPLDRLPDGIAYLHRPNVFQSATNPQGIRIRSTPAPGAADDLFRIEDFNGAPYFWVGADGQVSWTGMAFGTASSVPWGGITGKPNGFADDVDNDTTYSAGAGLALSGTTFSIGFAGVGSTQLAGGAVTTNHLNAAGVSSGQVLKYNGTHWSYAADNNTTYSAGTGLTLGGTQFGVNFGGSGQAGTVARSDHTHTATEVTSGTLSDARLSANVALLNRSVQTFSGSNVFAGVAHLTNDANQIRGSFAGDGAGLTNLNAAGLNSGVLPESRLPANVARLDASQIFSGANTFNSPANSFTGSGAGLTGIPASSLTGTISGSQIADGAIGTPKLAAGSVTSNALADGSVTAAKVGTVSNWFALTIANPTPVTGDHFGGPVAALGNDRVLIGAPLDDTGATDAGAAYLFSINGKLLTTFPNPSPAIGDWFGVAVAAVGDDRVLVGAPLDDTGATDSGAAYLFGTNGVLLTTFLNPTPAANDRFGFTIAALGNDRVLIGAPLDDTGATDAGAAYLFNVNGALLATFSNPTPAVSDTFGNSMTAVGSDRLLIGAEGDDTGAVNAGTAYLFNTNGTLVATFLNPTPATSDRFGYSVAALGSNRALIGAYEDDTGATDAGAAYLFNTSGTLLTTFLSPVPANSDGFSVSMAAVGTDRVLIGAPGITTGVGNEGAACLFNTNGTLLAMFTNPVPATFDIFGATVAAVGTDRMLVGAYFDDTGATDAGAAYLFSLQPFAPGLVADSVRPRSVATVGLEDGAVTLAKLDPAIGVWTRVGDSVHRLEGRVGIGTNNPVSALHVVGTVTATAFQGSGAGLSSLSASSLSSGTVPNAQISGTYSSALTLDNPANSFTGGGAGLTGLNASSLSSGTVADARLSGTYSSALTLNNAANSLSGSGAGLTALNASSLSSGTVPTARLSGTYSSALTLNNAANSISGNGAGLTSLNASSLASGTVPDARLAGTYSSALTLNNAANAISGNGAGLTSLNASSLASGTVADQRLSANVDLLNVSQTFSATKSFGVDSQLLADSGTNSQVGIGFVGDPNTGLYRPANNTLAVATFGSERMRVTSGGNVGIGTNNPASRLHVHGAATINGDAAISGQATVTGNLVIGGFPVLPRQVHGVVAEVTLTPGSAYLLLDPGPSSVTLNAFVAIADGTAIGQMLILEGSGGISGTSTVGIPDNANTRLSSTISLGQYDVLTLIWNGADWLQVSFSNN